MIQYTDHIFNIELDAESIEQIKRIIISLTQGKTHFEHNISSEEYDIDSNTVSTLFTQEETGSFVLGNAELQVNGFDEGGMRVASGVFSIPVEKNNVKRVIENE